MRRLCTFQERSLKTKLKRKKPTSTLDYFKMGALSALALFLVCLSFTALSIRSDYHSTTLAGNAAIKDVQQKADKVYFYLTDKTYGTLPLINANLVHSDLVLGDFQRVSALQQDYWNKFSAKSLTTLDKANAFMDSLKTTTDSLNDDGQKITSASVKALNQVPTTVTDIDTAVKATTAVANSANTVIGNKDIPKTLDDIRDTTHSVAGMAAHGNKIMANIDTKVNSFVHPGFWGQVKGYSLFALEIVRDWADINADLSTTTIRYSGAAAASAVHTVHSKSASKSIR